MASKDHGRETKAKGGLVRARGEANNESKRDMSTISATNESIASIRNKPQQEKWLFTEDQLENTPSRRDSNNPINSAKELNNRQQAANLIQDMGQRLPVNQLTINTAIVYMHRFYMFHSFQAFYKFHIASTALFLAAKVEEQPRKLEHVIRVCHSCLNPNEPHLDVNSDEYLKQAQRLVQYELIMLQTLGFDISIDHPHTHVVKCTQLVKASRDLSQTAYFLATNSLHLTNFCLKYKPTVVSAMCIHLSCKWSNYEIPLSSAGKAYWTYMDPTITECLLERIINEFLQILSLCPARLRKLKNYKPSARDGGGGSTPQSKDGQQPKHQATSKISQSTNQSAQHVPEQHQPVSVTNQSEEQKKQPSRLSLAEYNKREKESQSKQSSSQHENNQNKAITSTSKMYGKNNAPNVPTAQRSLQQHPHSNPKQGHQQRMQAPSNTGKPSHLTSHSGLTKLLTEPDPSKPVEKVHPRSINHHKRPEKAQFGQSHKPSPAVPSGIPGLQKPKHPTSQFTSQGMSQQSRKEFSKVQHHKPHSKLPLPPRPKEVTTLSQPTGERSHGHEPIASGSLDDSALEGMEQKLIENIKAEKTAKDLPANKLSENAALQKTQTQQTHSNHHGAVQREHKSRQSLPNMPSRVKEPPAGQPQSHLAQQKTYKSLYEHYKKNPESLKHQLKQKALNEPLTDEEKALLHKIKKKEEERQKKKHKHRLNRSQPIESHDTSEGGNVTPGGGPLTMRIKLPVRAKIPQPPTSGLASSSGSGSEAMKSSPSSASHKSGRKRTHGNDSSGVSDAVSAKHSRKSEGHHHQSHHSSRESSHSRHHHRHRPSSHHHSRSQIDDSTFQQALVNAVSMVQSGQAAPGPSSSDKVVPTVTLKRTGAQNGSGGSYVAHSSKHEKHKSSRRSKHVFDPSTPISATPPDDIFDGDREEYTKPSFPEENDAGDHTVSKNAELSSPETGEIRDDDDEGDASPFREHNKERSNYYRERKDLHSHGRLNVNNNNNPHQTQRQNQWSVASHVAGTSDGYKNRNDITQSDQR